MHTGDTICAISSAIGPCARIIVRMSGPDAMRIADSLSDAVQGQSAGVSYEYLSFRGVSIRAWIYRFQSPHSVTGEHVAEIHLPGNTILARWMLEECIGRGARQADPGEFTARAYFNGKMDLSQAEGVAATVSAHSESELSAARRLLSGELSRRLRPTMDEIADTLALVEAGIDFTDEDISFIQASEARSRISRIITQLRNLLAESSRFEPLAHLPAVVLVGRPNAGKSTLLNALAGHDRAVVSPVAGTTRDVLSATVNLARGAIQLLDIAGLETPQPAHASTADSCGRVAHDMQRRAKTAIETADFVILVRAFDDPSLPIELPRLPHLTVHSKRDLGEAPSPSFSAVTGDGIDELKSILDTMIFSRQSGGTLALNARHIQSIEACIVALQQAETSADDGAEILALELRDALDALGRVLGEMTPDDVLGRVFATFCIGK